MFLRKKLAFILSCYPVWDSFVWIHLCTVSCQVIFHNVSMVLIIQTVLAC